MWATGTYEVILCCCGLRAMRWVGVGDRCGATAGLPGLRSCPVCPTTVLRNGGMQVLSL